MHEHYIGGRGCQGDGGKILEWIVGNFRIEAGVDDVAGANNHDGVAVRSRVRSNTHAKISNSAWLVLDVELLTETAREFFGDNPCKNVGWPSGRKGHDHVHASRRVDLRCFSPRVRHSGGACSQN